MESLGACLFVCPLAIQRDVDRRCLDELAVVIYTVCLPASLPASLLRCWLGVARQTPASWWYSSMLALHRRQDGSLQICEQDVVVEIARRLGLDVPREKADRLFIHVQISRPRARLVVFHEPLRLIDISIITGFNVSFYIRGVCVPDLWYSPSSSSETNGERCRVAMTPVSVGSTRSVSRGRSGARDLAVALVFWCTGAGCEPIHFRTPSMRLKPPAK